MNIGTHFSGQPMYGQLIDLLSKRYSIRDVAKVKWKGREYGTTSEAINKTTITAIKLLFLRSFQKGVVQ